MTSTRELVLKMLLNHQRCTINDLAELVNINPISVRHHIAKLEAENLVSSEEERHGVGRPRRVYLLTEQGMERFPSRYLTLSKHMLDQIKDTLPKDTVEKIFQEMGSGMVDEFTEVDFGKLALDERVELARQLLTNQGFMIEIKKENNSYEIKEISCPYAHIGKEHPEVCIVDETMITTLLASPVEKTHCILDGDKYCAYQVSDLQAKEIHL